MTRVQALTATIEAGIRSGDSGEKIDALAAVRELASLAERAEATERERLEYPYAQVVGRNAAVLLTPEQIDLILHAFRDVSFAETLACEVTAEMRRARNALIEAGVPRE